MRVEGQSLWSAALPELNPGMLDCKLLSTELLPSMAPAPVVHRGHRPRMGMKSLRGFDLRPGIGRTDIRSRMPSGTWGIPEGLAAARGLGDDLVVVRAPVALLPEIGWGID